MTKTAAYAVYIHKVELKVKHANFVDIWLTLDEV